MELEVVIPVRNKDINLLESTLDSVERATDGPYIINLVDLGSKAAKPYMSLSIKYGTHYTRLNYNVWNKPLAMNYALKRSTAKWFGVLDGDYIVEEKFFSKILNEMEPNTFLQCRGYEMGSQVSSLDGKSHIDLADAITKYNMKSRPRTDYGGFQAFPTKVGKEIRGYDERFALYGGMHHEMRNRLINRGLKEKRLHGDPLLIHQTHESWLDSSKHNRGFLREERERHKEIIGELKEGDRVVANRDKTWGEV